MKRLDESLYMTADMDTVVRSIVILVAVFVLLPMIVGAVAMSVFGLFGAGLFGHMMPMYGAVMLLVWVLVIFGVAYVLYQALLDTRSKRSGDTALKELRVAFARGEIDEDEFESRRERLEETRHDDP